MLSDIKSMMLDSPESIVRLLEKYEFCHINLKRSEIRFARNEEGGQNISIRLENNPGIYVKDFVTGDSGDVIAYIMNSRGVSFARVLSDIKKILGLADDWRPEKHKTLFGGFYDGIGKDIKPELKEYPESVMDQYDHNGNKRWMRDGIPLDTQKKFGVAYDVLDDAIVFPWRSATSGSIIAVKARINYPQEDGGRPKYYFVQKGRVSCSLYGYSENYSTLLLCDRLFVFESEKSVMVCDAFGMHNAVAIGSNSLSDEQARLIASLSPKEVWFMLDKDLDLEETMSNAKRLSKYLVMKDCHIKYWNWKKNTTMCPKGAPVDMGYDVFSDICKNEMEEVVL